MKGVNTAVKEFLLSEEPEPSYTMGPNAMVIPFTRKYSNKNGISNFKHLTDREILGHYVKNHDDSAFNEIIDRYGDKILRTALRITRNPSAAEEILQEVFIILIEKPHMFHAESKFSTWLYSVVVNVCFSHLRAEKKHTKDVSFEEYISSIQDGMAKGVELENWSNSSDEMIFHREGMEKIEKAVNELPVSSRAVFHLRDVEGLTNPEVSEILNLSIPNVKFRIHRARLLLRDKLSDYFYDSGK